MHDIDSSLFNGENQAFTYFHFNRCCACNFECRHVFFLPEYAFGRQPCPGIASSPLGHLTAQNPSAMIVTRERDRICRTLLI